MSEIKVGKCNACGALGENRSEWVKVTIRLEKVGTLKDTFRFDVCDRCISEVYFSDYADQMVGALSCLNRMVKA